VKIEFKLEATSHPADDHHWQFTPECLAKVAEQMPGTPVTVNFKGAPVGFVDAATLDETGVRVSVSILAGEEARVHGEVFSPGFRALDQAWNEDFSFRDISFAEVKEISLTDD
jgi:hypothetical protein